ncbi:hypothetical protein Phi18:1_gp31 [Cellulophaga phage phi18:1]|uniref:Uncharacterized protein n=1 Tax=Cellulophaga phage phi18:1 TaxID=1327982 RepID=S0A2Q0_9CAUD|nr:hypothetical protein Phi18:1_gp31 [Cellulophaga phage phi18:1]AGO48478.1 hypothetical protein Phi18:1_gp31 [Cellulophaga phage phi18:1]
MSKCENCGVNESRDKHTCPFQEDVNNDSDTLCNCCSDCTQDCCMEI